MKNISKALHNTILYIILFSIFLQAGQMATVTVTVLAPQGTEAGTVDHITFSTTGVGQTTSLSLNLKVVTAADIQVRNKLKYMNFSNSKICLIGQHRSCSLMELWQPMRWYLYLRCHGVFHAFLEFICYGTGLADGCYAPAIESQWWFNVHQFLYHW